MLRLYRYLCIIPDSLAVSSRTSERLERHEPSSQAVAQSQYFRERGEARQQNVRDKADNGDGNGGSRAVRTRRIDLVVIEDRDDSSRAREQLNEVSGKEA